MLGPSRVTDERPVEWIAAVIVADCLGDIEDPALVGRISSIGRAAHHLEKARPPFHWLDPMAPARSENQVS